MALKFIDNFFAYGTTGTTLADANANFNTGWITHGTLPVMIASGFRANAKAVSLSRTASGFAQAERRFTSTEDKMTVGYAFRATSREATTFTIKSGATVIVNLEWPNQFRIGTELGGATILLNRVYFVEIQLIKSTKTITMQVNGYPYLTTTTTETIPDTIQCFWGYDDVGTNADFTFSDISFVDGSAGEHTDFMGPHRVITRTITDAVDPGWVAEPSEKSRVEIMNNIPALPAEYTEADTVGQKDFYKSTDVVAPGTVINGVSVTSLMTKTDIDDQYIALAVSDGFADKLGEDLAVPIQPEYLHQVFETDVAGDTWVPSTVQEASFGPVIRPRP